MKTKHFKPFHIATILLLLIALPLTASAYDFMVDGIAYNINSDNKSVTVTFTASYNNNNYSGMTTAIIPSSVTYDGVTYSVTAISESAFDTCPTLTSVSIPNSITSIGKWAFYDCTGLTSVTIPNSVMSIGDEAFYNCNSLTGELAIPNSVTSISHGTFYGCSSLTSITIPNSVTSIGYSAFKGCSGLTSITIGNSVTSIGNSAFSDCSSLSSITIPNSVTSIEGGAFDGCSGLTSVTIPNSVTSIGESAFRGCTGLRTVSWNVKQHDDFYEVSSPFYGLNDITTFNFGNDVKSIPGCICSELSGLTSVTIGNSVTSIGGGAFSGCSGLTRITIPNSVTSIDWGAFMNCSGLTSVTIPNSVNTIGQAAFLSCYNISSIFSLIEHPEEVSMGDDVFVNVDITNCILYVNVGTVNEYRNAEQWKDFTNITDEWTRVNNISISDSTLQLFVGKSATLQLSCEPADACIQACYWASSDPSVAVVDQNGTVSALAAGTATITATTTDGTNLSASCQVNISYEYGLIADTIKHTRGEDAVTIDYPVELINTNTITGLQFEVEMPENVTLVYDNECAEVWLDDVRKGQDHSIDVSELEPNHYFFIITSPTNKELKGHDGTLFYMKLLVDQYHNAGEYNINFTNLTLAEANETEHVAVNTTSTVQFNYMLGDADADAKVDVADYITTALYIMNRPTIRFYEDAANVNTANPAINVTDLAGITNIALGIRPTEILHVPSPASNMVPEKNVNVKKLDADRRMMSIDINNHQPMAAMQLDLKLPNGDTYKSDRDRLYIENFSIAQGETLTIPIQLDNDTVYCAFQTDLYLPQGLQVELDGDEFIIDLTSRKDRTHTLSSYQQADGAIRIFVSSQSAKPFKGNSGPIATIELTATENITNGVMALRNSILVEETGQKHYFDDSEAIVNAVASIQGDVNGDGEVDVRDITALIDVIMNSITDNPRADVNQDGDIDVRDITALIDIIMNS